MTKLQTLITMGALKLTRLSYGNLTLEGSGIETLLLDTPAEDGSEDVYFADGLTDLLGVLADIAPAPASPAPRASRVSADTEADSEEEKLSRVWLACNVGRKRYRMESDGTSRLEQLREWYNAQCMAVQVRYNGFLYEGAEFHDAPAPADSGETVAPAPTLPEGDEKGEGTF